VKFTITLAQASLALPFNLVTQAKKISSAQLEAAHITRARSPAAEDFQPVALSQPGALRPETLESQPTRRVLPPCRTNDSASGYQIMCKIEGSPMLYPS